MFVPSLMTLALGFAVTVALAVVDWYVWRTAPVLPYPKAPGGTRYADEEEAAFRKVA
ncbi:MAG TPA: hypothetical protein VFB33_12055 [Candidatus Binataceae bacterium]|nr:hypothetical protein [Candidatus Binataceae bacterium]